MKLPFAPLVALGALLLAACTGGDEAPSSSAVPEPAGGADVLVDTDWHLTTMVSGNEATSFEGTEVPRMAFEGDTIVVDDGVNIARGPYTLEGEDFTAGPLTSTRVAYPEPPLPAHALFGLVESATRAVVRGDALTLTFPNGQLELARGEPAAAPIELQGTSWRLTDVSTANESANATLAPIPAIVTFGDGTVEVYDGVNTATGTFEIDGSDLSIELGAATEIAYPSEPQPQYRLIELLPTVRSGELQSDGHLRLDLDGDASLTFEAAPGGLSDGQHAEDAPPAG